MANAYIDQPSEVRKSDALNNELLEQYVRKTISGLTGSMQVKQFKGGASNLTYQLDFDNRSIILRCPPPGTKAKSAHDMGREFNIMQKLKPVFPFVPEMIVHCTDETLIGREFYLMEKLNGIIPRANFPKGLQLSPKQCRELCIHFVDKLIALHSVDIKQCGLDTIGKGSGYVARQINGWSERYTKALTPNVATGEGVMNWLKKKMPEDVSSCLIHGDYRLDNAVLNPNNPVEITAILDWEMATIGDPLMDLGNSLAYWVEANDPAPMKLIRRQPSHLPGMMTRDEIVSYYCTKTGLQVNNFRFYRVYGLFRLAVIAQQIYYRYYHKQTDNPQFKNFHLMVQYLLIQCEELIASSAIEKLSILPRKLWLYVQFGLASLQK